MRPVAAVQSALKRITLQAGEVLLVERGAGVERRPHDSARDLQEAMAMKVQNAVAFLALGVLLFALPQLAPALCPASNFDGSSARALWLGLMGLVNGGIGAGRLCAGVWAWLRPWLEYSATDDGALPHSVSRIVQSGL